MKLSVRFFVFLLFWSNVFGGNVDQQTVEKVIAELKQQTNKESDRMEQGVNQVATVWRESDGSINDFADFCKSNFIVDEKQLYETFLRFDENLESIFGHNLEIQRKLGEPTQLEIGNVLPVDYLFAEYDPFAHIRDDLFKTKIAFVALLNFPVSELEERLAKGQDWSRKEWAYTRLAQSFTDRIPANVNQELTKAYFQADDYIANYNIYLHSLVNDNGKRLFPEGLKLITHWGLRDELKAQYALKDGLAKQEMIYNVMQKIITQEIPQKAINSDQFDWNPGSNKLYKDSRQVDLTPEDNIRYKRLLDVFKAERLMDEYSPLLPTIMDRQFKRNREIPEQEFENLISSVLKSEVTKDVAKLIEKRLGRKLEPFDIWYNGFKSRSDIDEAELDKIVSAKYPDVAAFQKDLPNILLKLGFSAEKADYLASKINVDPSRGAGHAMGAARREDNAHLRTRIPEGGMKYKGYNIAIHEFGHNVEQVFSLNEMDYVVLNGVPNNAFTEAMAFLFQSRDLDVLGKNQPDPMAEHLQSLDVFWSTCEIASVGLVDMRVWHWMYDNPNATPDQLKNAVIQIAKDVWNEYYVPIFGQKDVYLLGIYSHMISNGLYLPDYSLGHIIMFQIEQYMKGKNLGTEMERMCRIGSITPDAWMKQAVGSPVSAEPLIEAAREAVKVLK